MTADGESPTGDEQMRRPTIISLLWLGCAILCMVASPVVAGEPASAEQLAVQTIRAGQTRDSQAVKSIVDSLSHDSVLVRRASVWSLSQLPEAVTAHVAELIAALADQDSQVRWGAANAFGDMGRQAWTAETALWQAALDRDVDVRCAALVALRTASIAKHDAALATLSECLRSPVADVQAEAIATFAAVHPRWDDNEKRPIASQLATVFAGTNDDLRLAAAVLLGDLGLSAAESITELAGATDDIDEYVQAAALRAVGRFAEEVDRRWSQLNAGQRDALRRPCEVAAKVLGNRGQNSAEVVQVAEQFERLLDGIQWTSAEEGVALQRTVSPPVKAEQDPSKATPRETMSAASNGWRWIFAALLAGLGLWGLRQKFSSRSVAGVQSASSTRIAATALGETSAAEAPMEDIATRRANALAPFVQALHDADARMRQAAAVTLGQIGLGAIDAVPQLVTALADVDARVRAAAALSLSTFGPHAMEAVPALRTALSDEFAAVRARAVFALAQIGPSARRAAEELARLVSDPDVSVRSNVASALGGIGADTAVVLPALRQAAGDVDASVRRNALATLALFDAVSDAVANVTSVPPSFSLSPELRPGLAADSRVAQTAPRGSGLKIFDPEQPDEPAIADDVKSSLEVADFMAQLEDADADRRWKASQGLEQLGASAVPEMIASLNHRNPAVRRLLIVALGRVGAEARTAMPAMLVALHDVNADVRCAAADGLGHLGIVSRAMVQALVQSLCDPNAEVRRYAATTLGRFGQQARESMTALQVASISDIAAKVRSAAQAALQRIQESLVGAA